MSLASLSARSIFLGLAGLMLLTLLIAATITYALQPTKVQVVQAPVQVVMVTVTSTIASTATVNCFSAVTRYFSIFQSNIGQTIYINNKTYSDYHMTGSSILPNGSLTVTLCK